MQKNIEFVDLKAILAEVPACKTSIYGWMKQGIFPKNVKIGAGKQGRALWVRDEIEEWKRGLIAAREGVSHG